MPYIKEEARAILDDCIEKMVYCITDGNIHSDAEFATILGEINYSFSRILSGCAGKTSYSKVAMITGVLENIKQEYYRRVATKYEEQKIIENGDIKEYR